MKQTIEQDSIRTSVTLPMATYNAINAMAKRTRLSMACILQDAVVKYVSEKEPNNITDQNSPAKADDELNTSPRLEAEIPTTSGIDENDSGKDAYVEVGSENAQILDILNHYEKSETPVLCTVLIKKMITMSNYISDDCINNYISDDCINKLSRLASITEIEDLIGVLGSIGNEPSNFIFRYYIMNEISVIITKALKYRYGINYNINDFYPYQASYDECLQYLKDQGVKEDIDKLLIYKMRKLFSKPDLECLKTKKVNNISRAGMIITAVETEVLLIPFYVFGYDTFNKKLFIPHHRTIDLNPFFQQVFNLLDDFSLYFDIYDRALNHYRVWRLGRDMTAPVKVEVEFLQQF